MIRKLFKILKAAIVGAVWTVVFVYAAQIIMISVWNFDILNMRDWQVINTFVGKRRQNQNRQGLPFCRHAAGAYSAVVLGLALFLPSQFCQNPSLSDYLV